MRDLQVRLRNNLVCEQQDIDVDAAGPEAHLVGPVAPQHALHRKGQQQQGGGGGGKQRLVPTVAEIKMLRMMEEEVQGKTKSLEEGSAGRKLGDLTEVERRTLQRSEERRVGKECRL